MGRAENSFVTTISGLILSFVLVVCPIFLASVSHQETASSDPLDRTITPFHMDGVTVEDALAHLLISNHLVGGIATQTSCDSQSRSVRAAESFHFSNISLRQALDEIVKRDARHRWKEEHDGSIIAVPVSGMPELLKTRIKKLEIEDHRYTLSAASGKLLQLPEVKRKKTDLALKVGLRYLIGPVDTNSVLKNKVAVSDVAMDQALTAIAEANGSTVWRYSEYHCGNTNELSIDWVTR